MHTIIPWEEYWNNGAPQKKTSSFPLYPPKQLLQEDEHEELNLRS